MTKVFDGNNLLVQTTDIGHAYRSAIAHVDITKRPVRIISEIGCFIMTPEKLYDMRNGIDNTKYDPEYYDIEDEV